MHTHPNFRDTWNEYRRREYIGHMLDRRHFEAIVEASESGECLHSVDSLGAGCLDAPKCIPFGSTKGITTIGKYCREEYTRRSRETFSITLRDFQVAEARVAAWLTKLLTEAED